MVVSVNSPVGNRRPWPWWAGDAVLLVTVQLMVPAVFTLVRVDDSDLCAAPREFSSIATLNAEDGVTGRDLPV
jgi:hypothetical protein